MKPNGNYMYQQYYMYQLHRFILYLWVLYKYQYKQQLFT
jgi:hypothetical protein